ncbi:MAG: pyruvate dehydrogenase (acetyl-transferring) E1 component subunit alpha [archaeon]
MPKKTVAEFKVEWIQVLDENGKCDEALAPKLSEAELKKLYELMVLTRAFDEKAFKLQRQGRLGTYAQCLGQEASQVGAAFAMKNEDWLFPTYRDHGASIARGIPIAKLFQYWGGDERGNAIPEEINNLPVAIPVGTQALHATGFGMAMNIMKKKSVGVTFFGDGASSTGDVQIAMNFAGVFNAPVVFVCENNQYAISVPKKKQTNSQTIAQKAIAHGINGIQVDGNDVLAVYSAAKKAVEEARSGKGPTLIECLTYRLGEHTTADDSKKYRSESEVQEWRKKDPIARYEKFLAGKGLWNEEYAKKAAEEASAKVESAVSEYEKIPLPSPGEFFDYVYAKPTQEISEQKKEFLESLK